jgi:hypothetical protein
MSPHAMILRMHECMVGRNAAVRPALRMNEVQHIEHASPDPHGMTRIDALGET